MYWLSIVIIAYFLNALAAVIDKYLISKRLPQPVVYAFFISILGILSVFLIPFGFKIPSPFIILLSFIAGGSFTFALFYLFTALKFNDTTKITPFIGGLQPIFILFLSYIFIGERLSAYQFIAFIFLVLGTILITSDIKNKNIFKEKGIISALISSVLFALSYFLSKVVYDNHPFLSAFIWMRFFSFSAALFFLIPKSSRNNIINTLKPREGRREGTSFIFIFGQICGALSFFFVNYAIKINSVSLTNALQGLQYVFLLIMVIILSKKFPHVLEEKMTSKTLIQKISAILLISLGLLFLSL